MKLERKVRVKGKIHRRYDRPQTPYKRMFGSNQVSVDVKEKLKDVYESLNPCGAEKEH